MSYEQTFKETITVGGKDLIENYYILETITYLALNH